MSHFDVILVANGELTHDSTGSKSDYQSMILPQGSGKVIAYRQRNAGGRWTTWNVGELNPAVDPLTQTIGFRSGTLSASGIFAPDGWSARTSETSGHWMFMSQTATRRSLGWQIVSHDELREIVPKDNVIPKSLTARTTKSFVSAPMKGTEPTETEIQDWYSATGASFAVSRWSSGVFPSRPNGAHTYGPFTGNSSVGAPVAAGVSVSTEKRTFDKEYLRPNGQAYYGRSIDTLDDVEVCQKARAAGVPILAYGPPGTGKTALYEAAFGADLITVLGTAETEVGDFLGSYVQRPGEGYVWVDGPLPVAMEQGRPLLIDEIGLVDPKVLSIVYSVMDGRGELNITQNPDRGTVHAADGFYIVAATNPDAPGVVLSEALLSRFTVQVEIDSDYELATHLGVNKKVVRAAQMLDKKRRIGEVMWAPQLRELFAVKANTDLFGERFALRSLIASAPDIDRDAVCNALSKAIGETIEPLRMEG
jgi:nitric oxide reductase NorQ protein